MKTNQELDNMSNEELKVESEQHYMYSIKIDTLIKYKETFKK